MKYIESKPNGDGTYDHTEVRAAYEKGSKISLWHGSSEYWYQLTVSKPRFHPEQKFRVEVPDTYGIHESSATPVSEGGAAAVDMLLDRIKELESALLIAQKFCNSCASEKCPDEVAIPINLAIDKDYYK